MYNIFKWILLTNKLTEIVIFKSGNCLYMIYLCRTNNNLNVSRFYDPDPEPGPRKLVSRVRRFRAGTGSSEPDRSGSTHHYFIYIFLIIFAAIFQ